MWPALRRAVMRICQGLMVCDGAVAIFTPGAMLNDQNVLIVGNDALGTVLAEGSGAKHSIINAERINLGRLDDGVGILTIDDSVLNNSFATWVGDWGKGTLRYGHATTTPAN